MRQGRPTSRNEHLLEAFRRLLKRYGALAVTLGSGYLLGKLTNLNASASAASDIWAIFNVSGRPLNSLSWLSVILLGLPLVERGLNSYYATRKYNFRLSQLLERQTDSWLRPLSRGRIAIDSNVSLQEAPDLYEGWRLDEIQVQYEPSGFPIPSHLLEGYRRYYAVADKAEGFSNCDGDKFMICGISRSLIDEPTLSLCVERTKYSVARYFNTQIASLFEERTKRVEESLNGTFSFPHSFGMVAVVITSDRKVLMIHRSDKLSYSPNTWSISVDEGLAKSDLDATHPIQHLAERLLSEELGLDRSDYDADNFRALSLFLVGDVFNICLASELPLLLTRSELDTRMKVRWTGVKDCEIDDWRFVDYSDLSKELIEPTRPCVTSHRYSLLITLARHIGMPRVAMQLYSSDRA